MSKLIQELTNKSNDRVKQIFDHYYFTDFVNDFIREAREKAADGYYKMSYPIPDFLKMIPAYKLIGELQERLDMSLESGNLYISDDNIFLHWD